MDNKFNWDLFWSAFGAIGTTVGSIATSIAIIVALWQTKYSTKKKLKLEFSDNMRIYDISINKLVEEYVGVIVINTGNRDIIVSDWSILMKDNARYRILTELQ